MMDNIQIVNYMASGGCGQVYEGIDLNTGRRCALKKMSRNVSILLCILARL